MVGWKYEWGAAKKGTVDCSGAFVYAMKKYGLSIYHGSNTIWRSYLITKGTLGSIELVPGMAVFKWRPTGEPAKFESDGMDNFYHIGLYVGDGKVIEAKGTKYGVVVTSLDTWTHAGRVKGIQYITTDDTQGGYIMEGQAKVTTASGSLNLRASASSTAAVLTKIPQNGVVDVLDKSNPAWWKVSYVGYTGYAMTDFLTPMSDGSSGVRVVVPCASREDAEKLLSFFKTAFID